MPPRRVHYILSTHWDREWYQTFQDYRYRLVRLLDRIIAGWERDELRGPFQCDGQAIILEDYLEVRPERRGLVERLAREGKFVIGPWYVLPDEFLVSGESLVRNIALGRKIARQFGGQPSNAGFLCDMFGHNSQMPQIFAGFGITGGFIWRGTNIADQRLVRWRGADGTDLPCYRFGHNGYCSFAGEARYAREPQPDPDPELLRERLEAYLVTEGLETQTGPMLAFDGGDHMEWDRAAYAVIAERLGQPRDGFEVVHTSLDAYLAEMVPLAPQISVEVVGELREPGLHVMETDHQWLIPGVGSSRVGLKQANAACQSVLCQWAEPFSALSYQATGADAVGAQGYLDVAWKWLLMNHPHDSICGCSIDAVHEDMKFRFAQAQQIGERLTTEATRMLAASVQGDIAADEVRVTVFNPLPTPFDGVADLRLEIPPTWPLFNYNMGAFQPTPAFRIFGPDGAELAYQRLGQAADRTRGRLYGVAFPKTFKVTEVPVALRLTISALGYTTLTLRAGEGGRPTRHPATPSLATSECSMANEHLSVTVEPNGALTLLDKRTGRAYSRLLTFEDRADIGDGWNHGVALNDQTFVSTACRASVALVHNGPELATFRVRTVMELPDEFDFRQMARAERWAPLIVDSTVTLRAGAAHVEIETTVHNTHKDHRLRVLFPTGAQATTYLADAQFDVVERPIALRADSHLYREPEIEAKPQQTWTAVFDQSGGCAGSGGAKLTTGLAVISTGLLESAVPDLPERPIALTLFRATRRTVNTDGEPAGQLQGELCFRYWLAPLAAEPDRAALCRLGQQLEGGLRSAILMAEDQVQQRAQAGDPYGDPDWSAVVLPPIAGFLEVSGPAVVTSLRQTDVGMELRMFNPDAQAGRATITLGDWPGAAPTHAQPVNFEGAPAGARLAFVDGSVVVKLGAKKIVTLRLV